MRVSRIVVETSTDGQREFAFGPGLAVLAESPTDAERLLAVFRNLYLGIKRGCRVFGTIDDIEFEITNDMMPLIGQRLAGRFGVVDLALPQPIATSPTDTRDVQSVVARAALETIGSIPVTLDLERIDQAMRAIEQSRDPLADHAHAAYLRRTGLLQLFSRRPAQELLDSDDPTVRQLALFEQVLVDRRRQIGASSAPVPEEFEHATRALQELVSARMGGIPPEMAEAMSPEAVERDIAQWVVQQHDRQITPVVAELCSRHAEGIDVLGSIPLVLDLRRIDGLPPGGDAMRWAARCHADQLQFIVLVGDDDTRRWVETTFASSPSAY